MNCFELNYNTHRSPNKPLPQVSDNEYTVKVFILYRYMIVADIKQNFPNV